MAPKISIGKLLNKHTLFPKKGKKYLHLVLLFTMILTFSSFIKIPEDNVSKKYSLFNIGRSKDANEIFYDINLDASGNLNTEDPIDVYWIKRTDGDKKEPLTWIQKRYAYGIKFLSVSQTEATFQFVSYSKRTLTLKKSAKGNYKVFITSNNKEIELNRIFIQIDGGTFWIPTISKVELKGNEVATGTQAIEIIKP